jgi:hypothetical protein
MRIVGSDAGGIHAAAEALRADDLVVLPTDTVYGLAVRADRPGAAEALATAKGRPKRQAIAVLVAGMDQARSLALVDERFECLADAFWPGPLTLVALRRPGTALELGEPATTIGVRWEVVDPDVRWSPATGRKPRRVGLLQCASIDLSIVPIVIAPSRMTSRPGPLMSTTVVGTPDRAPSSTARAAPSTTAAAAVPVENVGSP